MQRYARLNYKKRGVQFHTFVDVVYDSVFLFVFFFFFFFFFFAFFEVFIPLNPMQLNYNEAINIGIKHDFPFINTRVV